jgi:hypothetical protein
MGSCASSLSPGDVVIYSFSLTLIGGRALIIEFKEIRHLIPNYIFNEYGQLTGNYVRGDEIVCEKIDGRVKIWLNREAFDAKDPERLICDYAESDLMGY